MTKPTVPWMAEEIERRSVADLVPYARNARTHSNEQVAQLADRMQYFGWTYPVLIDEHDGIIAGHGRILAAHKLKLEEVPVIIAAGWSEAKKREYILWDNQSSLLAGWDNEILKVELNDLKASGGDLSLTGFPAVDLASLGIDGYAIAQSEVAPKVKLADRFGIAPLSVLNAREGWWQGRKKAWISLGIKSEVGRGDNLLKMSDTMRQPDPEKRRESASAKGLAIGITNDAYRNAGEEIPSDAASGTSIFDPVLAELAYRWFCPPGGEILDPFAGGSVRGIVAAKLKRGYTGIDLRPEQVEANRAQAAELLNSTDVQPAWIEGDSSLVLRSEGALAAAVDFVFSCPPYLWLEVYSEDPRDLSTMDLKGFEDVYYKIISAAVDKLAPDRFACFVVGDVRDKKGRFVDFPGMTIDAFEAAGASLYNDAILVTAVGSLAMRAGRAFETTRKLGTTHQRVLVFVKGDPRKATEAIGKVEFAEIEGAEMEATQPAEAAPRKSRQAKAAAGAPVAGTGTPYGEKLTQLGGEVL